MKTYGGVEIWGCKQKFPDWVDNEINNNNKHNNNNNNNNNNNKNTVCEATQKVMGAELAILTHKITMQLYLVAESCTICSSRSRLPVRKPLDTPSYVCIQNLI